MLARRGVAVCILAFVATTLVAMLAIGADDLHLLYAISPYLLLFYAALAFLASEARSVLRPHFPSALAGAGGERITGVDDLVGMLGDTLKMARHASATDQLETVDLPDVLRTLVQQQDSARLKLVDRPEPIHTLASKPAIARALEILIETSLANSSRVSVSRDHGTSFVVVHVDDDGPGIPREERASVFDWRYYMSTPPSEQVGRRAELVIARQIVRAHGGDIAAVASPLGGTRFSVRLPLAGEHELKFAAAG